MGLPRFDWSDLVFFLELARQGRLVPAAKRLRADHTTVSRRVAELERGLNCKLFDRGANGFVLTDVGQKLFKYAEAIESSALAIEENVAGIASEPTGDVRVATMEGIGSFYLAPRMPILRQLFPEIRVELVTERHLISLTKREADISVSFAQMTGPRLISEAVGTFQLRLYASPQYLDRIFSAAEDARLRPVLIDQVSVMRSIWLTLHEDHQYLSRIKAVKSFLKKIISDDQPFLNGLTIP